MRSTLCLGHGSDAISLLIDADIDAAADIGTPVLAWRASTRLS